MYSEATLEEARQHGWQRIGKVRKEGAVHVCGQPTLFYLRSSGLRGKVGFPKKRCFLVFDAHPDTAEPQASKSGAVG